MQFILHLYINLLGHAWEVYAVNDGLKKIVNLHNYIQNQLVFISLPL